MSEIYEKKLIDDEDVEFHKKRAVESNERKHEKDDFNNNNKRKKILKIVLLVLIVILLIGVAIFYFMGIPIVEYKGEKVKNVEYGSIYNDEGINVYTKFKNINDKVITESNVDTSKLGAYTVTYKVPYLGKYKEYNRSINVVDTEKPELTLNGDVNYKLTFGKEYQEQGYTAKDNYDGDLTEKVSVNKTDIDENNYDYHYEVTDSSGNKTEVIRHVNIVDDVAPKITLKGSSVMSILIGGRYTEQGATATDNKDGDVSSKIKVEGNVDTSKEGTYTVTYTVSDSNGNVATEKRKVMVGTKNTTGVIYLTFDDGPSSTITPHILDVLKEKGVKATFFVINYSEANEYLVKREVEEGHAVGIHGYSHDYAKIYKSVDVCYGNIKDLQEKIYKTTGVKTNILRVPGGSSNTVSRKYCPGIMSAITKKVLEEGFKYYDWNVASGDSGDVNTKEAVYNNVTKGLKPGRNNIVLMHDFSGNKKTLEALPGIIDYGLANGYTFDVITTDTEMVTQKVQN